MINTLNDVDVPCLTCGGFIDAHINECPEVPARDEAKMGGKYHGPSNSAGFTRNEYWEMRWEEEDEQERLRNDW